MKYFTRELWLAPNQEDDSVGRQAVEQFEQNCVEYQNQLQNILPRLDEVDRRFFLEDSLHDGRLIAFIAGDEIDFDAASGAAFDINSHNTSVRMKVLGCNMDTLFTLEYTGVRRAVFDYPTEDPLFHYEGAYIGDWGYDELTAADDVYLRHEVLFASGTSVLIEFKKFSHNRLQFEGKRYKS